MIELEAKYSPLLWLTSFVMVTRKLEEGSVLECDEETWKAKQKGQGSNYCSLD